MATYSAEPQIANSQPPDMKFACLAAAHRNATDDEPPDRERSECKKPAGDRTERDGADCERPRARALRLGRRPDIALLAMFIHYVMHSGKALRGE